MKYQKFAAVSLAAGLLFALAGCGKTQSTDRIDPSVSAAGQTEPPVNAEPSADAESPADTDTSDEASWKVEFEKSLLENYGVKPDHYEALDNGVYQVYVDRRQDRPLCGGVFHDRRLSWVREKEQKRACFFPDRGKNAQVAALAHFSLD